MEIVVDYLDGSSVTMDIKSRESISLGSERGHTVDFEGGEIDHESLSFQKGVLLCLGTMNLAF